MANNNMYRNVITLEEAFDLINNISTRAEGNFHAQHARFPSYTVEGDYVLLGDHLNITQEAEDQKHSISGEDIAHNLVRRYLTRQGFFDFAGDFKETIADGLLGRAQYNPPSREYGFRIDKVKELQGESIKFLPRIVEIRETMKQILAASFLRSEYRKSSERYLKGHTNLGTHFINPVAWFKNLFNGWEDYESVLKSWSPLAVPSEVMGEREFYH